MSVDAALAAPVLAEIKKHWFWFLLLGLLLIFLGVVALGMSCLTTIASVMVFGWFAVAGGILEAIVAFQTRSWQGFMPHALCGVVAVIVGLIMVFNPVLAALGITLFLAAMFLVEGTFRIAAAITHRSPNWGWGLFSGLVAFMLGIMIMLRWPASGLWVIGMFVGIDLIFRGTSWLTLAMAAKNLPQAHAL